MIKKVVRIETTHEMVANDINEFILDSNIDKRGLQANETLVGVQILENLGRLIVVLSVGEKVKCL